MIVAAHCGVSVVEEVVSLDSAKAKDLAQKAPLGSYPMLELDDGSIIQDSLAIASYIAESSGNGALLGSGAEE